MRKVIVAIVLAAVLVAGGLGGFAYANNNPHPMTGQKLVGQTTCVKWEHDGILWSMPGGVTITNPDCVSEITIDRVFIFAYDGTVVYEGPLRVKVDDVWEEYTGPVRPHQLLQSSLEYYSVLERPMELEVEMQYTVEIFWTCSHEEGLPLTGWVPIFTIKRDAITGDLIDLEFGGVVQMVNMEQELELEDLEPEDDEDED